MMFDAIFSDRERRRYCFTGIEEATLVEIAVGAAVAGAAVSAAGAVAAGNQQDATAKYNANVEQTKAQEATAEAATQAAVQKQQTTRQLGEISADYGAAGVDPSQGSPLSVMSDQAGQGELARRLILYRGQTGALSDQQQSVLDTAGGSAAQQAGLVNAGSTILTGASKAATLASSGPTPPTQGTNAAAPGFNIGVSDIGGFG